jgi:arachidonate 15-lipoxygenase
VAGPNPVLLKAVPSVAELPEAFAVRDHHLVEALSAHRVQGPSTLAEAAAQGRLFLVDYAMLADLPARSTPDMDFFGQVLDETTARQRYLPAPFGLFCMCEGQLQPVAVQLGRNPQQFEVFTPADEPKLWGAVKMIYLCADFNLHEMATHLSGVHFILEGVVVSTARQLHTNHPVAVLLENHFRYLLWNNFIGRQTLVNPGGFTEQLLAGELMEGSVEIMRRHYAQWDVSDWDFPAELASRGTLDADRLPFYPFRDDGLVLWEALGRFVSDYVELYYASDQDVAGDPEVAAWAAELASPEGAHLAGFPATISSREQLSALLHGMIFRSSAYHSAVNFGQYTHYSYPARTPGAVCADPRQVRETARTAYLPGGEAALTQVGIMHVLAGLRDLHLADADLSWYEDPATWPLIARLRQDLAALEARIDAGGRPGGMDYDLMRPSKVTAAANV